MKVSSSSSTSAPRKSGGKSTPVDGFRLPGPEASTGAAPVFSSSGTASIGGVEALLALQGLTSEGAKDRSMRRGRRILDALDRLQIALLGEGPTRGHLEMLKRSIQGERESSGDSGLDAVLNWAEIRVAVEAAKLEAASAHA